MSLIFYDIRELQFIFILIGVVTGYQITYYFFSQYMKFRRESLGLNKILLAYGFFFSLGLTGILFRNINKFYIEGESLTEIYFKITNSFLILSIILFLILVSSEIFSQIMNPTIIKTAILLMIIPLVSIFFFEIGSLIMTLIMIIPFVGIFTILIFQSKLIKLSVGIIKKRLILIFLGELLILGSFLFGGEVSRNIVLQENEQLVILITSFMTIITFFIVYLGVYKFPVFFEFDWKAHLLKLYIIDQKATKGLYTFDFKDFFYESSNDKAKTIESDNKDKILSVGLIGINDIISACSPSESKITERIYQEDIQILFKYGDEPNDFIIYAMTVDKYMDSFIFLLKIIKDQFQGFFKDILLNIETIRGKEETIFSTFDILLKNLLTKQRV